MRRRTGASLVPRYVPGGRVLDVGCGSGELLRVLALLGWDDRHGIELDAEAAKAAAEDGVQVRQGSVEANLERYPDAHFDAIVSSMVVEHLGDPFTAVRQMVRKLRPGGELLLSTICRDTPDARLFGEHWAGYDFPRHMVIFRREDIRALLGDDVERIEWFPQVAPTDWIRSASWRGRASDKLLARAGVRGLMLPCAVLALAGRSSRMSLRCAKKAPGAVRP